VFRTPTRTDQATNGAQVAADKAAELKVKAGGAATVTAASAVAAKEKAAETAEVVKEKAQEAAEAIAPRVEQARETFVDDVLPKVAGALATIAAGAAAARETAAVAAERAPDAYAVLKGDAVAKKSGRGRWILLLGALAAGAAVMAWRKSNERPDPWATAGSYTPPKPVSEKVSDLAAAAKEKATGVKDAAVDKAGELKHKAGDATDTAKHKAGDATDAVKDKALDAETAVSDPSGTAGDPLAVPAPVILSDAEINDGAFDDAAAAADTDTDTTIPALSETSEGADLSTPHLDGGSTDRA
jgi:hypothetical protein